MGNSLKRHSNPLKQNLRLTLGSDKKKPPSSRERNITGQIERYIDLISNEQYSVRVAATKELCGLGAEAVPVLLRALLEGLWYTRECAAQALGCIGDLRAIEPLIDRLGDENVGVRRSAASALSELIENEGLAQVAEAIRRFRPAVRRDIVEAIRSASPLAGRRLVEVLGDSLRERHRSEQGVSQVQAPSGKRPVPSSKRDGVRSLWDIVREYFQSRS